MPVEAVISAVRGGLAAWAVGTLVFGAWSAVWPGRSIALYQAIMRFFNWRVEPIDQPRELRTTRWLGSIMVLLGMVNLILLWQAAG
jgi:hypothetical protein